jgi:hypothetical protein
VTAAKTQSVRSVFETLLLNGFTQEVISVIPPNAPLTSSSKVPVEALGKVPGRKMVTGQWCGGWIHANNSGEAQRFARWGGNAGIETTRLLPIDIDVNDPSLHKPLILLARRFFGVLPLRMGKRPLLFGRLRGKCSYGRIAMTFENETGKHKIESFHGEKKHFVIAGVHPAGMLYRCSPPLEELRYDDIPEITEQQVLDFFTAAKEALAKRYKCKILDSVRDTAKQERSYEKPDVEKVIAPLPFVKRALEKIPNTKDRGRWVDICHAVKGATQKTPAEGLQLWLDWCATREDGDPHLKEARRVWDSAGRQDGGLYTGYEALLAIGGLRNELAQHEFKDAETVEDGLLADGVPLPLFSVQPVQARPLRRPEWVIRNMVPKGACLGVMYGPPGMNKSTMATAMAVHIAVGLPFADQPVKPGHVLLISEEDAVVNRRRLEAWRHWLRTKKADGATLPEDWERSLQQRILETFPGFGHISKKKVAHLAKEVLKATSGAGIQIAFIDTLARTFVEGGEENEAKDMNKYIDLAEGLSEELDCPVIVLHHPPKNADTLRGHGSLLGAVSMVLKVERTEDGLVRLYCQKMREAAEFAPLAFERRAVDISFAVERKDEEDTDVETALVLEHTPWTEVAGNKRQGSAAADPANLAGSPQRVTDMDILRHLCLHPGDSVRTIAAALGFGGHPPLLKRLHRLHEFGLVEQVDKRWKATEAGSETFSKEHPDGLLM